MAAENFKKNQEIPNLNLSDYEEQSIDSDSQFLSPDDLSFGDQNLKTPTTELPLLNTHFKNIPYTKTELSDSLVNKMSNLNLANSKERPDTLDIGKTLVENIKALETMDSGKDIKLNSVLQMTTDHPLKILSPDIDYPDVIPKIVTSETKLDTDISNVLTPQRNNSKNNLYLENTFTPEYQSYNDIENNDIPASPPNLGSENLLNNEIVKKKVFNASILCKNSSTPLSNIIKEDNVSAIGNLVQTSNKIESDRNINNAISEKEREEQFLKCPQSPDILSSPSQEDRSKYQAIIDPYSCNVILKHTPSADSAARQNMRRRIVIPDIDDNISTDSGSVCSLELEEDSPELPQHHSQDSHSNIARTSALEQDSACAGGESSGVRETVRCRDGSASNAGEKSASTSTSEPIPEYSLQEERYEVRSWLQVPVSNGDHVACDMRVIEPFKRVLSHGGYTDDNGAIIVISACRLPHYSRQDYQYVMTHLFLYVMYTIEKLVTDSYVLVYVHGAASKGRIPNWHWFKESYKLIDRRLRKSMKRLYIVHPTFWLRSILFMSKPFVSHKFYNKVTYVNNLRELMQRIPVEPNAIPDIVKEFDSKLK